MGVSLFAGEYMEGTPYNADWSFGLGVTAGILLLISGIVYAVIAEVNDYTTKPESPYKVQYLIISLLYSMYDVYLHYGNTFAVFTFDIYICHRGCAYAVLRTVQRLRVHSAVYGTVHCK